MSSSPYRHTQSVTTTIIAPPPDDSDFLESESEHDGSQSVMEHPHEMTEMEAELAAVATPTPSQLTTPGGSAHRSRPAPAGKIMQMTHNFSFTYFHSPMPRADALNAYGGRQAAGLSLDPDAPQRYTTRINQDGSTQSEPLPASTLAPHIPHGANVHWFCIDSELVYLSFFEDWGPLNVAMFYRFCLHLHHLINSAQEESTDSADEDAKDLHLILYTSSEPKPKANAALLAAMYAMVCGNVSPADAFHPISSMELLPFRDAGYGRADYYLTIQDILYGVHRAIQERLLDLMTFDLEEYETYEQVQNGDWNWITPNIIAFASPNDKEYVAEMREQANGNARPTTPGLRRPMNSTFQRTVKYFKTHNVRLVVRLNNPLYDSRVFTREGIEHVDMYFDDGSNPCDEIVRDFIAKADKVISSGGAIAVHCKAGLGRTGVLIGAYLAYRHGFAAGESIGFMRIMRPGCVVGPQQHFMYQEATKWMRWREQDDAKARMERALATQREELLGKRRIEATTDDDDDSGTEGGSTDAEVEEVLGDSLERHTKKRKKVVANAPSTPKREERRDDTIRLAKPAPCVGQPRKSPSPSRKRAAQAQAPATIARMGGHGTLGGSRGRIVSADNSRSASTASLSSSSSTEHIIPAHASSRMVIASPSPPDFGMSVDVQLQVRAADVDGSHNQGRPRTPPAERAVAERQSLGTLQNGLPYEPTTSSTHGVRITLTSSPTKVQPPSAKVLAASQPAPNRSEPEGDDRLFVEGWNSPEPPSTFAQRLTQSSPQHAQQNGLPSSPPASPSSLSGVHRASPHIRERFGLRDTGSNQNTPRSCKIATAMSTASQHRAGTYGSSQSLSSNDDGSLTSRDAAGSSDDLSTTPTLQAGPLEKILAKEMECTAPLAQTPSSRLMTASSPVKGGIGTQASRSISRIAASRPNSRTVSNSSATSNTSQQRAGSVSRPPSSMTNRRAVNSVPHLHQRTAAPSSSVSSASSATLTTVRRHASSAANSTGRVAAARERLAQQQSASDLQQRSSVKRPRAPTDAVPSRAPSRMASVNAIVPSARPALGSAPSATINAPSRMGTHGGGGVVPRFAMSTAASAAKSAAATAGNAAPISATAKAVQQQTTVTAHSVSSRFGPYSRPVPHHHHPSTSATSASLARLHGRNVHRRRSSLGETDIVM